MRNLSVRFERQKSILDLSAEDNAQCHVTADGKLFALVGKDKPVLWSVDGDADVPWDSFPVFGTCVRLLGLSDEASSVVLAFREGSLVLADLQACTAEVVGQVEHGIEDLVRSPDEELFALITRNGSLVLMSREFDPLVEVDLRQGGFGQGEFVNVGWGKKETQFHGSLGKAAATQAGTDKVDVLSTFDDGRVRLVWREDGQLFAVSSVNDGRRNIRVYSREGVLQATSEVVEGLEHSLAWKPSGSLIASTERLPNKLRVVFFEKNGLRHGEFQLPFAVDDVAVTDLAWNRDSDALLVCARSLSSPSANFVQVYSCSNYTWSLKQSWKQAAVIRYAQWDLSHSLRFHLVSDDGNYQVVQLCWEINHSRGLDKHDLGLVSVVDGSRAKMTPFRQLVVPPPMSAFELHISEDIGQVIFHPSAVTEFGDCNTVGLVTKSNTVFVFSPESDKLPEVKEERKDSRVKITGAGGNGFAVKCSPWRFLAECRIAGEETNTPLNNFCWLADDVLIASSCTPHPRLVIFELKNLLDNDQAEMWKIAEHTCEEAPFSITSDPTGSVAAIQLSNGIVLKYDRLMDELTPWPLGSGFLELPSVCVQFQLLKLADNTFHVLGLNERHRLYFDGVEASNSVTSFHLHSDFLMVTTLKHLLRCLPLDNLKDCSDSSILWSSESVRALERGSKLVLAVPKNSQTVLQMPRGNLEVIHPRALVLHLVREYLDEGRYRLAMEVLRRHRINLNLVVDHSPAKFLEDVNKFVAETEDVQRLCLFIADLAEEDCTKTMYASMYQMRLPSCPWSISSRKVDTVCEALMKVLEVDEQRYILPVVSCLIKSSQSDVASALSRISEMRGLNPSLAVEALQFLLLLVDVNRLFDVALGMYDFDLVLFVAEKSQKDPKEFLPFLNELKKLPLAYRKYKIDLHLKRYAKALQHLSQVTESDSVVQECLELIKSQRLYSTALTLFTENASMLQNVCRLYGHYLMSKKYYDDAALIFDRGGLHAEAVEAWEKSLNWRYCLATAQSIPLALREFQQLCQRLVESLKEERRHQDASLLLKEYMGNDEEAIATLVQGHHWSDAYLQIKKTNRRDLMETHFVPCLKEHSIHAISSVRSKRKTFDEQLERLVKVLEMRQKVASGLHEEVDINVEDADLYSEASSVAGAMSGISGEKKSTPGSLKTRNTQRSKSSKNRRKHEKKKFSTREGSSFEDVGLVSLLHENMTSVIKDLPEVGELTRALLIIGDKSTARDLQLEWSSLILQMKGSSEAIWKHSVSHVVQNSDVKFGPNATTDEIVGRSLVGNSYEIPWNILEPHMRYPPNLDAIGESWKLKILDL